MSRLTTIDNPFDPFTEFIQWNLHDVEKGYNTACRIARIIQDSEDMSEQEEEAANERAIDEIMAHDYLGVYIKLDGPRAKQDTESS